MIDGLTPSMLEGALGTETAPTLTALAERGTLGRATTTFPSLTPVCLSSIATGAHPDVHEIPHLVWWHRGEQRLVEYGSSFGAARAAGLGRTLRDTLVGMNAEHLGKERGDALRGARGRRAIAPRRSTSRRIAAARSTVPPSRCSTPCTAPSGSTSTTSSGPTGPARRSRSGTARRGSIDAYAAAVGRWLVTRDGFDFLLLYLSDYDYASHAAGPDAATEVLARCDAAVGGLVSAAGGLDEFLERYAVVVMSDHGQTAVHRRSRASASGSGTSAQTLVTASNRAAHVYRLGAEAPSPRALAERLDGEPSVEVALFAEGDDVVARREGAELRIGVGGDGPVLDGDARVLDHPDAVARAVAAVRCPNAGEVVVSAARGLGVRGPRRPPPPRRRIARVARRGRLDGPGARRRARGAAAPGALVDVAPAILAHFGARVPEYAVDRAA